MKYQTQRIPFIFILMILFCLSAPSVFAQIGAGAKAQSSFPGVWGAAGGVSISISKVLSKIAVRSKPTERGERKIVRKSPINTAPITKRAERSSDVTAKNSEPINNSSVSDVPIKSDTLSFRPTGTILKASELANLIGRDAGEKAQLVEFFRVVWQEYAKEARRLGKPNDFAFALSVFLASNSSIYHDMPEVEDEQTLALRDRIAAALVESGALNNASDRQKQEMSETLIMFTGLAIIGYQDAKESKNAENLKIFKNLAGITLRAVTGISPDKIRVTDEGLVIEADPAGNSEATVTSNQDSTSNSTVPNSIVGEWNSFGSVGKNNYYNPSTGEWTGASGNGRSYEFLPNGRYIFAQIMQVAPYNCTTTTFTYVTGSVVVFKVVALILQRVESLVLDFPASASRPHHRFHRPPRERQRCHPRPASHLARSPTRFLKQQKINSHVHCPLTQK